MKKNHVDVIFDRKKKVAKTGKGFVELRIYLNHKERKHISLGEITPDEWDGYTSKPSVQYEIMRYESIIQAMLTLGTSRAEETCCHISYRLCGQPIIPYICQLAV